MNSYLDKNTFILDSIDSWPQSVIDLVITEKELVQNYITEVKKLHEEYKKDIKARYNPQVNVYESQYISLKKRLESILYNTNLLAFHCSNLTDSEIDLVMNNGLKPLSQKLVNDKLYQCYSEGHINEDLYKTFVKKNALDKDFRIEKVCVFHNFSTFEDEWSIGRLLSLWGGEYLYSEYEDEYLHILENIGSPCVFILKTPFLGVDNIDNCIDKMIKFYLGYDDDVCWEVNSCFSKVLNPVDIIRHNNRSFFDIVRCKNWKKSYTWIKKKDITSMANQ